MGPRPLSPSRLVTRCDPRHLPFATSDEVDDQQDVVGQERAVAAAQLATGSRHAGFNLAVLGPDGSGRRTLVRRFLAERAEAEPVADDVCYVHDFVDPQRPRILLLPPGTGRRLRSDMQHLVVEIGGAITAAFESDAYRARREALDQALRDRREEALAEVGRHAEVRGTRLVRTPLGMGLLPVRDGEVLEQPEFDRLPEDEQGRIRAALTEIQDELEDSVRRFPAWERDHRRALRDLNRQVTHQAVGHLVDEVRASYPNLPDVDAYLRAVQDDVEQHAADFARGAQDGETEEPAATAVVPGAPLATPRLRRFEVNVLVDNAESKGAPVVYEDHPTHANLVGRIEHASVFGALVTDHTLLRPGALHRAAGGYLMLELRDLLSQPYAWDALKRALLSGELRMESLGQALGIIATTTLEPEPMPLAVKVVLIADRELYYLLSAVEPKVRDLFKVEADFEDEVDRDRDRTGALARLLATIARRDELHPLTAGGAAALVDQAARRAGDARRLTADLRYLVDVMREADHRAGEAGASEIGAEHVAGAVVARRDRGARIHRRVMEAIGDRTLQVQTRGHVTGQVNALTVARIGDETFGWPTRVTARVRIGRGEVIDIEREVELGGPIHSKGVLILSGFLGQRFAARTPLSLQASIVFEQSYAQVEGDSASLAELCALLSAIGELPIAQGIAVTGSVDQRGDVQAVGAVNEKIEGFFDACRTRPGRGPHGVIIPAANVEHLMLRADVVEAATTGNFRVFAVHTVDEAMELLTGRAAGRAARDGTYPRACVNGRIQRRLEHDAERLRVLATGPDGQAAAIDGRPARRGAGATLNRSAGARRSRTGADAGDE